MAKKVVMEELEIGEISGVTQPMNEHALSPVIKAAADVKKLHGADVVEKRVASALTNEVEGHQHGIYCESWGGEAVEVWMDSSTSTGQEYSHSHPLLRNADGTWLVGVSEGHSHTIDGDVLNAACIAAGAPVIKQQEEIPMPTNDSPTTAPGEAPVETSLEDIAKLIRSFSERTENLEKVVALSAGERLVYDKLGESDRAVFLAGTADQRALSVLSAQKVALSETEDTIVLYTDLDGRNYTRKDSPELMEMAKSRDSERTQMQEFLSVTKRGTLEKRAAEEYQFMSGTPAVKAQILELVESIPDETEKSAVRSALKQHNELLAISQKVLGTKALTDLGGLAGNSALGEIQKQAAVDSGLVMTQDFELRKLAETYMNDNPGTEFVKAYRLISATPQGVQLLQERYDAMPVLSA